MVWTLVLSIAALVQAGEVQFKHFEVLDTDGDGQITRDQFTQGAIHALHSADIEKDREMIADHSVDYLKRKRKKEGAEIALNEIQKWIEGGDYLKNYERFAKRVWRKLVKSKDAKAKGVSRKEILENPQAFGYTYKQYKELIEAERSHDDL